MNSTMKYALLSLSDKENAVSFAEGLIKQGYRIIATGGTSRFLKDNGIPIAPVEEITGFPEILNGRVKTLNPKILGGILADRDNPDHLKELNDLLIAKIDIVAVNLYPFQSLLNKPGISHALMIENIDIGGVTLLRAAAKNYQHVSVVTDKNDYQPLLNEMEEKGFISEEMRMRLAGKAFSVTTAYDRSIMQYYRQHMGENKIDISLFPNWQQEELRYGENPHQKSVFLSPLKTGLIEQLHGKQLSYNNFLDINAALKLIYKFSEPTAAILKHTNPCGVASADDLSTAYKDCFATDPLSPFGGIVVFNKELDLLTAEAVNQVFTEIIIAPDFADEALDFLLKKKQRRLIKYEEKLLTSWAETQTFLSCLDGLLCQDIDIKVDDESSWKVVTEKTPTAEEFSALRFCWKVVSVLKSNAICLGTEKRTLGLGMGQTSRIDSAEIAVYRAEKHGHRLTGAVCASDGFFPFRDNVDYLAEKGINSIIQPGGSKGDEEVIKACDEHGISMVFTGVRHFAHS